MERSILISIHPDHVKNIMDGVKLYEYRKAVPKDDISHLVIYATAPEKRVVAVVEVTEILSGKPSYIWKSTKEGSGISRTFYNSYFKGRELAHAIVMGELRILKKPMELKSIHKELKAPQSFLYLKSNHMQKIQKQIL